MKKALVYGISGQDGHYLSGLLLEKGYEVAGAARGERPEGFAGKFYSVDFAGDLEDVISPLDGFAPDEVYNLAGISNPREADADPALAFKVNSECVKGILSRLQGSLPSARFFQASSAYMFGKAGKVDERTAPAPTGAYGESKLAAHLAVAKARGEGAYACSGILFNHESPLRTKEFVTRKISLGAAQFSLGMRAEPITLGNLDVRRDWGFAGDYVEAMWLMLQQKEPDDYVIATGESHTVREFCQEAFSHIGMEYEGKVISDPGIARRNEQDVSADSGKIRRALGWKPRMSFKQLVGMMVDADIGRLKRGEI